MKDAKRQDCFGHLPKPFVSKTHKHACRCKGEPGKHLTGEGSCLRRITGRPPADYAEQDACAFLQHACGCWSALRHATDMDLNPDQSQPAKPVKKIIKVSFLEHELEQLDRRAAQLRRSRVAHIQHLVDTDIYGPGMPGRGARDEDGKLWK